MAKNQTLCPANPPNLVRWHDESAIALGIAPGDSELSAVRQNINDATPDGLAQLRRLNSEYRKAEWPAPFNQTSHRLHKGDARDLSWLPNESVHLVVTSPPYWTLKTYAANHSQMGAIEDYGRFLDELDRVWAECCRVLAPGGRICCVVGDVCVSRKGVGRHHVIPLHADIQVRSRMIGLDCLTPILRHKIANGVTEAEGNGAGFYGRCRRDLCGNGLSGVSPAS